MFDTNRGMGGNQNIQLNYSGLVLTHLSRISALTTYVAGILFYGGGSGQHDQSKDKDDAYSMAVTTLKYFIPDELRDDEFKKELQAIIEQYQGNKQVYTQSYYDKILHACINLLARRGVLFEKEAKMGFYRPNNKEKSKDGIEHEDVFES